MLGIVEDLVSSALLADGAGVHNDDLVTHLGHNAQVMGDHDNCHAQFLLQLLHELQDLGLDGHVQSGGGLIGNQNIGLAGQGHGDHNSLAHAAGKLEGILLHPLFRLVDVHQLQHFHSPVIGLMLVAVGVQEDCLHQLVPDGIGGIQGGHGVLENNGNLVAADVLHFLFGNTHQLFAVYLNGAGDNLAGFFQNLHNGIGGDGLTGAAFAHNAQDLATIQIEGDSIDGFHFARRGEEGGMQIVYF